jgi:lysyl-tRNA synthetase class 1
VITQAPLRRVLDAAHERVRDMYGGAIGRRREDLVTPALVLDIDAAQRNIDLMAARLRALPAGADAEAIQNEVYEAGKAAGFEPLRAWFTALYEVLLGQQTGPRFGSFVAIFGVDRTLALMDERLAAQPA